MTRPPHATPEFGGVPYMVERRVLAGIPCLIERPLGEVSGLALVYHGVTASKEGNLGIFTALVKSGVVIVLPDGAGHGERREAALAPSVLGYRNFLWTCAARAALEAPALIDALSALFPNVRLSAVGISMGGYTAHLLALREKRVSNVVVISSGSLWDEPEVTLPLARTFIEDHRPVQHARLAPPTRLLLLHGEDDPVFPMSDFEATRAAYGAAYDEAGQGDRFAARSFPGVGHYTAPAMRDHAIEFLLSPASRFPLPTSRP